MIDFRFPRNPSARLVMWSGLGWVPLSDIETDDVWQNFKSMFGFFGTGIREPARSLTWDMRWVYAGGKEKLVQLEFDLNAKALSAIRESTVPGERVYALDWMHQCYWFDPRGGVMSGDRNEWAVPVLPNGDHYVFLGRDMQFGLIGVMDESVCVFGERLLAALAVDPPVAFARILRRGGRPV